MMVPVMSKSNPSNDSQFKNARRKFLKTATAVSAAMVVPRHVLGGPNHVAPSDKVNVAIIGAGGRGLQNARELMKLDDVRIPFVADPAAKWDLSNFYYRGVAGRRPSILEIGDHYLEKEPDYECEGFIDYREMLERRGDQIDAVLCGTPDHLHALVSLHAMRAGKHVYCEKPLTHNVAEARLVAKVAKDTGLATQMGNQGHSRDTIRETCELIWAGAIGDVTEVHAWVPATRWNKTLQTPPLAGEPVPSEFNWDLWCGPRTPPKFHSVYAPVAWRDFWDFGCGALGDFGCHDLDSAVWALDLGLPHRVEMFAAGKSHDALAPYGEIGTFDFDSARVGKDAHARKSVRVHWYSGGLRPPRPTEMPAGKNLPSRGVLFVGTDGVMVCGGAGGKSEIYPEARRDEIGKVEPSLERSPGHHRQWIDAIKGKGTCGSEFQYGAKLTEITLLGLVSLRSGEGIDYDGEKMQVTNSKKANELLTGEYRDSWKLEG